MWILWMQVVFVFTSHRTPKCGILIIIWYVYICICVYCVCHGPKRFLFFDTINMIIIKIFILRGWERSVGSFWRKPDAYTHTSTIYYHNNKIDSAKWMSTFFMKQIDNSILIYTSILYYIIMFIDAGDAEFSFQNIFENNLSLNWIW